MDLAAAAAQPTTETAAVQHQRARREIDPDRAAQRFSETGDLLLVAGPHGGVVSVNEAWAATTGWTLSDLEGRQWSELLFCEDSPGLEDRLATGAATREVVRVVGKGGSTRWLEGAIQRDARGSVICVLRDITADRNALVHVQDARDSHSLMRMGGMARWTWDPERGTILSPEMAAMFGVSPTWARDGGDFLDLCHPDDRAMVMAALSNAAVHGGAGSYQHRSRTISGRWLHLKVVFKSEPYPTGGYSLQGMIQDITELAEARDAALAAAEAKTQFLASVSHEIRTPMNGVLGVLHLLRSEALSGEGRKLLDEAVGCGHMLSELINDVLDFSKIEAEELELSPEPIDPFETLTGVANLLRPLAQAKGLSLTVDADPDIGWVDADPIRLRQALFNLIGNAVKFTLAGGVSVRLTAALGDRVVFEVADTGVGIPEDAHPRLFDRFQQADSSTTRRFGGTGLGLAITKRLAELMGGDVDFDSVEGEGSTFRLTMAAPRVAAPGGVETPGAEGLGGLRVLVVEDNATNRLIARKLLEHLGAFVAEAENGEQGVEAALAGGHDLILMDVQMPVMDGLEATRRIRAGEEPRRRIPIIALTANVLSHQTLSYREAGMNGVVAKPVSPVLMLNEIARVAMEGVDTAEAQAKSAS